ncbi:MAG: aldehyde dehydrogenase family protein [Candidatus Dojkabacteria bacterium]
MINNEWRDSPSGETLQIVSPWDGQEVGCVPAATAEQAVGAVHNSKDTFGSWRRSSIKQRVDIFRGALEKMRQNTDLLIGLLSKEIGKTEESAKHEIDRSLAYIELVVEAIKQMRGNVYYGDITGAYPRGRKTGYYSREPLGVVLAISPFNYPINLSVTKIAPAVISGNTVVLKPSTQGSLTAIELYKYFVEAGLPPGVLNIITGKSSEIGDPLLTNKDVSLIAFTGSTGVGNHIRQVANGIPLLLELGGKDTAIVTSKADLEVTAEQLTSGGFSYCGQRCTAQKMVLVYEEIADELVKRVVEGSKHLNLNPLIDDESADFVSSLIDDAVEKGAVKALGGKRNKNHIEANVLDHVTDEMRLFHEEQFGPVLPIVRVTGEEEALAKHNSIRYGLQGSVYTNNIEEAFRIADKLEVGTVQINGRPDRGPDNFPFGGVKDSGQFMQGTIETIELMTRGKLTVVNLHKYD